MQNLQPKKHKQYSRDETKILKAKKLIGAGTETGAIEARLAEVLAKREPEKGARSLISSLPPSIYSVG